MSQLQLLKDNEIEEYIVETIKENSSEICDDIEYKYHHNTKYEALESILANGILPIGELINRGIMTLNKNVISHLDDEESHINGINGISLCRTGLNDLSRNEEVYDPFMPSSVDILISKNVKARRMSKHYGNEFITYDSISNQDLISIDIRLLKLLKGYVEQQKFDEIVKMYNSIIDVSSYIYNNDMNILLREMSYLGLKINNEKFSTTGKILRKE